MQYLSSFYIVLLLCLSGPALSASIFKCVDAAGKITFTQNQNCPSSNKLEGISDHSNVAPSGSGPAVKMADTTAQPRPGKSQGQSYTVVGAPEPIESVAPPVADKEVAVRPTPSNQPCIKIVEKMVSSRRVNADGTTIGRSQIVKVPVAC